MAYRFFYLCNECDIRRYIVDIDLNKLRIFGKGYIVTHCITLFQKEKKEEALINYVTTGLQFISENVAVCGQYFGADGRYLAMSFESLFDEQDERSAEEIRDDIMRQCGLGG